MSNERDARIRERAYQIWEEEGSPDGLDEAHWAQAEKEFEVAAASTKPDPPAAQKKK